VGQVTDEDVAECDESQQGDGDARQVPLHLDGNSGSRPGVAPVAGCGPAWSGIFAAFPISLLPLVALIHYTYVSDHAHAILKNLPRGLGSLVAYSLTVSALYPTLGVLKGPILAYLLATVYLAAVQLFAAGTRNRGRREDCGRGSTQEAGSHGCRTGSLQPTAPDSGFPKKAGNRPRLRHHFGAGDFRLALHY